MPDRLAEIKANHLRYGVCLPGCRECWLIARIEVLEAANRELVQVIGTEYDRAAEVAESKASFIWTSASAEEGCQRIAAAIRQLKEADDGLRIYPLREAEPTTMSGAPREDPDALEGGGGGDVRDPPAPQEERL
jgi:hypothetical protein